MDIEGAAKAEIIRLAVERSPASPAVVLVVAHVGGS
jgi:hypothetical protein